MKQVYGDEKVRTTNHFWFWDFTSTYSCCRVSTAWVEVAMALMGIENQSELRPVYRTSLRSFAALEDPVLAYLLISYQDVLPLCALRAVGTPFTSQSVWLYQHRRFEKQVLRTVNDDPDCGHQARSGISHFWQTDTTARETSDKWMIHMHVSYRVPRIYSFSLQL